MTYFTAQLWREMNQEDYDMRERAHNQWVENSLKYQDYFKTIKHRIPKPLLTKLDGANDFHDFTISGLSIRHSTKQHTCWIELLYEAECFYLELSGLKKAKIDIVSFEQCILGELRWGYHEFRVTEANTLQLFILCDLENELFFEFERIALQLS